MNNESQIDEACGGGGLEDPKTRGLCWADGDLLRSYEHIAAEMGEVGTAEHISKGISQLLKRITRSLDPTAALNDEVETACSLLDATATVDLKADVERAKPLLESPIEMLILPWLLARSYQFFPRPARLRFPGESAAMEEMDVAIVPQLPIGKYRVDFAIAAKRKGIIRFVVVECDGASYHDAIDQVRRDVNRDVAILRSNRVLDVVRFDGKDITRSPSNCAAVAANAMFDAWRCDNHAMDKKFEG